MKQNLTGKVCGNLKVLGLGKRSKGKITWNCLCKCGNYRDVITTLLNSGKVISCGCKNYEMVSWNRKTTARNSSINGLKNRYSQNAKSKKYEWELNLEKFTELVFGNCFYCGIKPLQFYNVYNKRKDLTQEWINSGIIYYNGIDRKDNSIGYTENNCVSCCFVCNRAKRSMDFQEFKQWINRIINYHKVT